MSKVIALTGTSGAMGSEVLLSLMQSDENFNVRCILFDEEKTIPSFVKKIIKKYQRKKLNCLKPMPTTSTYFHTIQKKL